MTQDEVASLIDDTRASMYSTKMKSFAEGLEPGPLSKMFGGSGVVIKQQLTEEASASKAISKAEIDPDQVRAQLPSRRV